MSKTKCLDEVVEMSLYELATGSKQTEIKTVERNGEIVETITITRHLPPDIKAIKEWLYNKKPNEWSKEKTTEDGRVDEIIAALNEICEKNQ
jgi:hypothetical protein